MANSFRVRNVCLAAMVVLLMAVVPADECAALAVSDTLAGKTRLSERELANKKEGSSIAVLPGPAFSPDLGLIIGAVAGYYQNGLPSDPLFAYEPYNYAITGVAMVSSRGMYSLSAQYGAPHYRGTPYRVRAETRFERNPIAAYYGSGERSLRPLTTPDGRSFTRFVDYQESLLEIHDGRTYAYYDQYLNTAFQASFEIGRNLGRSPFRAFVGLMAARSWIDDYTDEFVPAKLTPDADRRTDALMLETRLLRDHRSGLLSGMTGGWDNAVMSGFAFDTRDLEPNPRRGMFHDATFLLVSSLFGSDFDYAIATLTSRFYHSPFASIDIVLAGRAMYSARIGSLPFYRMSYIPNAERPVTGLGGEASMRGFREARFTGREIVLANLELRYIFHSFRIGGQFIELMAVPFLDVGGVYDDLRSTSVDNLKYSYGAGFRMGYNQAFVVSMDVGYSEEERGMFYLGIGHIF